MSANFIGNALTQSEAIETYTPYDVTSSRPRKTTIAFFWQRWRDRKITLRAGPELKFENYESVQHRLQFSGIKKGAKISFHRHFKFHYLVIMPAKERHKTVKTNDKIRRLGVAMTPLSRKI